MIERIIIQQTRQVKQYEPLKIEVHIMPDENWKTNAREAIDAIHGLLYPEAVFISISREELNHFLDQEDDNDDDYEPSYEKREEPDDVDELEETGKDDIRF